MEARSFEVSSSGSDQREAFEAIRESLAERLPLVLVAEDPALGPADLNDLEPGLFLLTSGTTGDPKLVHRPWSELEREVSPHGSRDDVFLLTYSLARYAGLQVALHCIRHGSSLAIPDRLGNLGSLITAAVDGKATHISATPSLMRRLIMAGASDQITELRQITLGGEYADQSILDSARRCWPSARVTTIYASTEAGACFSSSDGLEGFPARVLGRGRGGRTASIDRDGQLIIEFESGKRIETGDYFDLRKRRLLFRGRREEIINVGGSSVSLINVERVLCSVPGVEAALARGRRNPLTGHVVTAEVVGDFDRGELTEACEQKLAKPERPVSLKVVDHIDLSSAEKLRRATAE